MSRYFEIFEDSKNEQEKKFFLQAGVNLHGHIRNNLYQESSRSPISSHGNFSWRWVFI